MQKNSAMKPRRSLLLGKINPSLLITSSCIIKVRLFIVFTKQKKLLITEMRAICLLFFFVLGTAHGFAARPNLELPDIVEAYQKAMEQIVSWFVRTL